MKQIQTLLPASLFSEVTIIENGESLVELVETPKLKIGWVKKAYQPLYWVRKTVAEKLYRAAELLPPGMVLVVIEGYRTTQSQQEEWDRVWAILRTQDTQSSDNQISRVARKFVALPLPLANHHCGGAVDVTLAYSNATKVDMGSPYITDFPSADVQKSIPMFSSSISPEAHEFRSILRTVMAKQGFVYYPNEWWHYCYGDRMWAVYTQQKECFYGSVDEL